MSLAQTWGKLFQAVTALVCDGEVRTRLIAASRLVLDIDRHHAGVEDGAWLRRFAQLQDALAPGAIETLATERAEWLAEEILSLFIDVDRSRAEEQYLARLIDDGEPGDPRVPTI